MPGEYFRGKEDGRVFPSIEKWGMRSFVTGEYSRGGERGRAFPWREGERENIPVERKVGNEELRDERVFPWTEGERESILVERKEGNE